MQHLYGIKTWMTSRLFECLPAAVVTALLSAITMRSWADGPAMAEGGEDTGRKHVRLTGFGVDIYMRFL